MKNSGITDKQVYNFYLKLAIHKISERIHEVFHEEMDMNKNKLTDLKALERNIIDQIERFILQIKD